MMELNWNPIFRVGPIPINWYGVRSEMFSVAEGALKVVLTNGGPR